MKTLDQLDKDIRSYFNGRLTDGDKFQQTDPSLEKGFQLDLYKYLKYDKGHEIVYELTLPDLAQYVEDDINEGVSRRMFSYQDGSLRPDLVVKVEEGFVCIELKYNETDVNEYKHDLAKCKVYVQHCTDVTDAYAIDLLNGELEGFESSPCADPNYKHVWCYYDNAAVEKVKNACSIEQLWQNKKNAIAVGKGEFAQYGE